MIPLLVLGATLLAGLGVQIYLHSSLRASLYARAEQRVSGLADVLLYVMESFSADFYSEEHSAKLGRVLENMSVMDGIKTIYILKPDLTIAAHDGPWLRSARVSPEIATLVRSSFKRNSSARVYRNSPEGNELVFVKPLEGGFYDSQQRKVDFLAAVVVIIDLSSVDRFVAREISRIWLLLGLGGSLFFAIVYITLQRRVLRPVGLIDEAVKAIAGPDFTTRAKVVADDEIGRVAAALNTMLGRLEQVTVSRDELERVNRELIDTQAKMVHSSKMSALGEMAGGVAHEVNNPLAVIHARACQLRELAREKGVIDSAEVEMVAEKIKTTVWRISKIVKSLLAFARDKGDDRLEKASVSAIVSDTLELCREKLKHMNVNLEVQEIPSELSLWCRPWQISQVLLNLLSNANDALEGSDEKWIRITCRDQGDSIELRVADSGKGIPFELVDKIMQPFFTSKAVGKGTGLGLSISKGIVESHGGSLWLDLASERTTFVVSLPKVVA